MVITEIGGTVGDIESLPFLEAVRQVRHDVGRDNVFFLHISLVPYIGPSGELKTKPTQHSVAALRSIGIQPDAIVCRSDRDIPPNVKRKISLMCDVDEEAVVAAKDAPSIYDIPKVLHAEGLDAYVVRRLGLPFRDVDWTEWDDLLRRVHRPEAPGARRAGRQVRRPARRLPLGVPRRCGPAGSPTTARSIIRWVTSDDCETPEGAAPRARRRRRRLHPRRLRRARHRGQARRGALRPGEPDPDARPVPGPAVHGHRVRPATSPASRAPARSSSTTHTPHPVIATMAEQQRRRRGRAATWAAPCGSGSTRPSSPRARSSARSTDAPYVEERHRHRYEVNNSYREQLEEAGLVFSGTSPDGRLVEYVELPRDVHPYFVATQAHPEFRSRPARAHPLFAGLVAAALDRQVGAGSSS